MLKFINEEDFLKEGIIFKENEDGSVSWVWDEGEGLPTHSGIIREGFIRKTQIQEGTEEVVVRQEPVLDEEGNPTYYEGTDEQIFADITEEQPIFVDIEIDVWEKLQELVSEELVTIEPLDLTSLIEEAKRKIDSMRDEHIASGVEFEGDLYQTKPVNVTDMMEAAVANRDTQWLTADNTIVAMPVTKLNALIQQVANKKELYIYKARQHKDNVLNLTTKEDIDDYMSNLTW